MEIEIGENLAQMILGVISILAFAFIMLRA